MITTKLSNTKCSHWDQSSKPNFLPRSILTKLNNLDHISVDAKM